MKPIASLSKSALEPTAERALAFEQQSVIADKCPGFAMCRTDFLGVGVCPPGKLRKFASYYPQGRMQVISAFAKGRIPLTKGLIDIAESCLECGICDKQCFFVSGIKPGPMHGAFKALTAELQVAVEVIVDTDFTRRAKTIVGDAWASNDPAICVAYSSARSPLVERLIPACIVLPGSTEEVGAIIRLCREMGVEYLARGSGTSLSGAITSGVLIDLARLTLLDVEPRNQRARIGAAVTAFQLQQAADKLGFRANVAEPAACVCANILNTNMHSLFSYAYGLGADHVIDATFVDEEGAISRLSEGRTSELLTYRASGPARKLVCTEMSIRLFPKGREETTILIPFESLEKAAEAAYEIASRRVGIALGVVGTKYMSLFAGYTTEVSQSVQSLLEDDLQIRCFLMVLGHPSVLATVKEIAGPIIDKEQAGQLLKALPNLKESKGYKLLMEYESGDQLFKQFFSEDFMPLLELAMDEMGIAFEKIEDRELREFFDTLYTRPELTDVIWLNAFRILPARMGRDRQFFSVIAWMELSPTANLTIFIDRIARLSAKYGIEGGFGYFVPVDNGSRIVIEYDFYYDQNSQDDLIRIRDLMIQARFENEQMEKESIISKAGSRLVGQGMSRFQSYLFG